MRTGAIIYPILSSYNTLTNMVAASKIFAVRALQGTQGPYIVYREIASTPTNTNGDSLDTSADPRIRQRSILDVYTVQISVFADTYLDVEEIAIAVRQALDREWGSATTLYADEISLDSCVYQSCVDDYDDDYGERGIYIKHLDFSLRVNRIFISNTFLNEKSIHFDGVDDKCEGIDSSLYTPTTDGFSISVWVKMDTTGASEWIAGKNAQWGSGAYHYEWDLLKRYNDSIRFRTFFGDSLTNNVEFDSVQTIGTDWTHIVVSYDGSQTAAGYTMWINNTELTQANTLAEVTLNGSYGSISDTICKFMVGFSGSDSMSGNVDEVTIWSEVLSSTKVSNLYNNGKAGSPLVAPTVSDNLVGYWRMGDGATYPNIPDNSPQYSNQIVMTNMTSGDIESDVPPS